MESKVTVALSAKPRWYSSFGAKFGSGFHAMIDPYNIAGNDTSAQIVEAPEIYKSVNIHSMTFVASQNGSYTIDTQPTTAGRYCREVNVQYVWVLTSTGYGGK